MCALRSSANRGGRLSDIVHLHTGDYPGLAEAIEAAVPKLGTRPRSMIACGAGPVNGRTLKLTNAPWVMDGPEAARRTGLSQGLLLNDFEAQALSLPTIPEGWERRIGPLKFGPEGPQVILGPGTGLGIAALVEADGRFTPVSSEACQLILARSGRRNSRSGLISNARTGASPARASFPARASRASTARA